MLVYDSNQAVIQCCSTIGLFLLFGEFKPLETKEKV